MHTLHGKNAVNLLEHPFYAPFSPPLSHPQTSPAEMENALMLCKSRRAEKTRGWPAGRENSEYWGGGKGRKTLSALPTVLVGGGLFRV